MATSRFMPSIATKICDQLSTGRSLTEICEADGMPDRHTVRRWVATRPEFREQFEAARRWWCESVAEETNDLADRAPQVAEEADSAGRNANAAVQALRVQIDTKKWLLSKLAPQVFGDHVRLDERVERVGDAGFAFDDPEARSRLALALLHVFGISGRPLAPAAPVQLRLVSGSTVEVDDDDEANRTNH